MIKIFRKIRQDMIQENRASSYLLYAIGEIVLVVLGILIALQINNWNETRKEIAEEQKITFNLNAEFRINLIKLDTIVLKLEKSLNGMDSILKVMSNTITIDNKPETFDRLLTKMINNPSLFPSSIVLKELESSGKLAKLKDPELKKLLYSWNFLQDELLVTIGVSNNSYRECIDYLKANGSLRRVDFVGQDGSTIKQTILSESNRHLLSDLKFENVLDDHFMLSRLRKRNYDSAAKLIKSIIASTATIDTD